MDINVQLQEFKAMRQKLTELTADAASAIASLDVNNYSRSLEKLHEKLTSDTFKIMVMGSFKNGKSTFINSLLGEVVLPAYVTPCTAIINEVKYNSETKAILYFMDPLPETYTEVPEKALAHMHKHGMKNIPPLEISIDEIEDYLTIPLGMGAEEAGKQSAYEKMELFWPLELRYAAERQRQAQGKKSRGTDARKPHGAYLLHLGGKRSYGKNKRRQGAAEKLRYARSRSTASRISYQGARTHKARDPRSGAAAHYPRRYSQRRYPAPQKRAVNGSGQL